MAFQPQVTAVILSMHSDERTLTALMQHPTRYPCPCCGYLTFREKPNSYAFCAVCGWQDDDVYLRYATWGSGPKHIALKHISLVDAQKQFQQLGQVEIAHRIQQASLKKVWLTAPILRDPGWRPIDLTVDAIEDVPDDDGTDEPGWPKDRTLLYYWRDTYWRR